MTSALQNRLVGTIIVVALIVIFVPEFLDGEKRTNQRDFVDVPPVSKLVEVENTEDFDQAAVDSQVPQAPELSDEKALDEPVQNSDLAENNTLTEVPPVTPQENEPTPSKQTQTVVNTPVEPENGAQDNDALPEIDIKDSGWVVQLGSFRHEKNVKELLKTLNDAGYRTYTRPVKTAAGELTKVFVGPELEKEKLEQALSHLQEITKLKGKITPFEVSAK